MKNRFRLMLIFPLFAMVSCSLHEKRTMAHITQRRIKPGGRLEIAYRYRVGNEAYSDSVEMENRIVPHDSVKVAYSLLDPGSSRLLIP